MIYDIRYYELKNHDLWLWTNYYYPLLTTINDPESNPSGPLGLSTPPRRPARGRCRRRPPRSWWSSCAATLPARQSRRQRRQPDSRLRWKAHPKIDQQMSQMSFFDRRCLFAFADVSKNLLQVAVGGCLRRSGNIIVVFWLYDHWGRNRKCH